MSLIHYNLGFRRGTRFKFIEQALFPTYFNVDGVEVLELHVGIKSTTCPVIVVMCKIQFCYILCCYRRKFDGTTLALKEWSNNWLFCVYHNHFHCTNVIHLQRKVS